MRPKKFLILSDFLSEGYRCVIKWFLIKEKGITTNHNRVHLDNSFLGIWTTSELSNSPGTPLLDDFLFGIKFEFLIL